MTGKIQDMINIVKYLNKKQQPPEEDNQTKELKLAKLSKHLRAAFLLKKESVK